MDTNNSFETVAARAQRVQQVQADVEARTYRPTGEDIAEKILQAHMPAMLRDYHQTYLRRIDRSGQRRITTLFAGEASTFWVNDDMSPEQDQALYEEFWTAERRLAQANAERLREWREKTAALNAAEKDKPAEGSFERHLFHELLSVVKSTVTVCAIVVFVLVVGWAQGWWLR